MDLRPDWCEWTQPQANRLRCNYRFEQRLFVIFSRPEEWLEVHLHIEDCVGLCAGEIPRLLDLDLILNRHEMLASLKNLGYLINLSVICSVVQQTSNKPL